MRCGRWALLSAVTIAVLVWGMLEALQLADGDHRRLDVYADGAVVVRNHTVR
jgi:hypothetical protein